MNALLPGPGYSWSPFESVPSVEFTPVGSVCTFLPKMFSPAASALIAVFALGWSLRVGAYAFALLKLLPV